MNQPGFTQDKLELLYNTMLEKYCLDILWLLKCFLTYFLVFYHQNSEDIVWFVDLPVNGDHHCSLKIFSRFAGFSKIAQINQNGSSSAFDKFWFFFCSVTYFSLFGFAVKCFEIFSVWFLVFSSWFLGGFYFFKYSKILLSKPCLSIFHPGFQVIRIPKEKNLIFARKM